MTSGRLSYPHRRRGLDHAWFLHEPMPKRAPITWPDGRPVALWITVPIEFFPLDAPSQPVQPVGGLMLGYPDLWNYSNRDYGLRIGIYRVMRVLDGLRLTASAAVNAAIVPRYPRVIDEMLSRDWEFIANGLDMAHVHHGGLAENDEREQIRSARAILMQAINGAVAGWHSPGRSQSPHTLRLLAELGFEYVTDWANDDMPYMVKTESGPLCALPLTYEWSDRRLLVQFNLTVEDYVAQVLQAFARLRQEAVETHSGRILSLSITPWILGYPHRIGALQRLLAQILESGAVWHGNGTQIASLFKQQAVDVT
jgi:allantoinase